MSEKTEAPTGRKIAEARAEGQITRSQELNVAVGLLIGGWLLSGPGQRLAVDFQNLVTAAVISLGNQAAAQDQLTSTWVITMFWNNLSPLALDLGLLLAGILMAGVITTVAQTGFLWASKRIGFDFNRVNPLTGFKRLFSGQGLVELVKAFLKLVVVGWVAYSYLRGRVSDLLVLGQVEFASAVGNWARIASDMILRVGASYLVLAILDYAYQRWQHTRSMRMSKEEVKEDMKRSDGDPFIKSRIRSQQRRMARSRMMASVPKADVIITNPTHLAIALRYDAADKDHPSAMQAPVVLAKGAHRLAERIVALARLKNIPVVQNIPLARAIYQTVEINQEIPPDLYRAVAEVLAYIYRQRGAAPAAAHG